VDPEDFGDPGARRREHQQARGEHRAHHHGGRLACLGALGVEQDQRFSRRNAVGIGELLVDDEVPPQRDRQQDTENPGDRQPEEGLQDGQVDAEAAVLLGGEHVEGRQQPAEEGNLSCRRPGSLDDVVLPAIVVAGEDAECQEAEERRHDRDVRAEPELQHDVGI